MAREIDGRNIECSETVYSAIAYSNAIAILDHVPSLAKPS